MDRPDLIYLVVGKMENVSQDGIGGEFKAHPSEEIVAAFYEEENAQKEIDKRLLKKEVHQSYGDSYWYRGGYYEMYIETCGVS